MAEGRHDETASGRLASAGWNAAWRAVKGGRETVAWNDPVVLVIVYLVAVSALFVIWPSLDLAIARLFFANGGFPAKNVESLIRLRALGDQLIILILVVLAASMLGKLVWPERPIAIRPRSGVFLLTSLALGPGLVVNGLFKSLSGRPRPIAIDIFGGPSPFVPAWRFSDYCASNCSFVSGEGSSSMWLMGLVFLLPKPLRLPIGILIGLVALALSVNRLAFGGHFASDVLVAWGLTLLIQWVLYRLIVTSPLGARIDAAVETWLGGAGRRLRARFR
ncbi:phosphoesterase PA-phosphatase [Kaistia algarum]|uniref:phosphatase PAP2 family protein n=1 Tax=Kaistia algarum TaxID=2083279 RepID=UPI000CE89F7D|nr:phosphatase PAP2 family protein [Kaistia algarum]MCX5516518.1 phosphatase PAP2 family protein [Kaistia algarum]PPE78367.1 phosphoesterase PA-phosphatase [Kaistia algarum]